MDINVTPEEMFSLGAAVAIIPVFVGHLKPALRRVWPENGPWELIADLVGVLWVFGLWQAGYAPDSITNPWAAVVTGLALGIASSRARDGAQAVAAPRSRSFATADEEWVEEDAAEPAAPSESRSLIKAY